MRLLLDEMFPASIAQILRHDGHDVVAVQEQPDLRQLSDPELFVAAQEDRRAVVTENVKDFATLVAGPHRSDHHGLILTTNRSFPRHRDGFVGALVTALRDFLDAHPGGEPRSLVHWLQPRSGVQPNS